MQRRRWLELVAAASAAAIAWPTARADALDTAWHDPRRGRDLPLRMRWPAGDAPCALVVHSHGLGGNRQGGDVWGRAWQQAGFAVLHVQHPGSDTEVLSGGMRSLRAAASAEQLRQRVADMQFAVDEVVRRAQQGESGWSRVRLDALGASGHSFGAVTVQALAGQRFSAAVAGVDEPRLKAFIAFSPSTGQGLPASTAFAGVTRPFLAVTGSLDTDSLGRGLSGTARASVVDAMPSGQRALLWLEGADHMSFAGNAEQRLRARSGVLKREPAAADNEDRHHALVAAVTTLWWRARLLGDPAAVAALREPARLALAEGDRWRQD